MSTAPSHIARYVVVEPIAAGGMGEVFLARDANLDRLVAIKLLRDGFDNDELRARFEEEARNVARLTHPNIVTIYEYGAHDGRPYIAMEYVAGHSLADIIRRRLPLPLARRVRLIEELCSGLSHAHKAHLVHRDVKPANLMMATSGLLKVLDFGIAKLRGTDRTQKGMLVGTVNYMSPEQITGQAVDSRSDVFAVGAVLHELLTYEQAFKGDLTTAMFNIVHGRPEPLATNCPGLDPGFQAVLDRCLAKSPSDRYQDLLVLKRDLARLRRPLEDDDGDLVDTLSPLDLEKTRVMQRTPVPSGTKAVGPDTGRALAAALAAGEAAIANGQFESAVRHAEQALALQSDEASARDLLQRATRGRDAAAAEVLVARARHSLAADRLDDARSALDAAGQLAPPSDAARGLKAQIERRIADLARFADAMSEARRLLAAGDFERARQLAATAVRIRPDEADARRLTEQIDEAAGHARRSEEQRRAEEEQRRVEEQRRLEAQEQRRLDEEKRRVQAEERRVEQERRRVEEEQRVVEETQRLAAEAQRRAEAEQRRADEDRRRAEQAKRTAEEAQRRAAEQEQRRAAEAQRRAEEAQRLADAEREARAVEVRAAPPDGTRGRATEHVAEARHTGGVDEDAVLHAETLLHAGQWDGATQLVEAPGTETPAVAPLEQQVRHARADDARRKPETATASGVRGALTSKWTLGGLGAAVAVLVAWSWSSTPDAPPATEPAPTETVAANTGADSTAGNEPGAPGVGSELPAPADSQPDTDRAANDPVEAPLDARANPPAVAGGVPFRSGVPNPAVGSAPPVAVPPASTATVARPGPPATPPVQPPRPGVASPGAGAGVVPPARGTGTPAGGATSGASPAGANPAGASPSVASPPAASPPVASPPATTSPAGTSPGTANPSGGSAPSPAVPAGASTSREVPPPAPAATVVPPRVAPNPATAAPTPAPAGAVPPSTSTAPASGTAPSGAATVPPSSATPSPAANTSPSGAAVPVGRQTDEALLRSLVNTFGNAYQSKDLRGMRAVWPGMPGSDEASYRNVFNSYRSISWETGSTNIQFTGDRAQVRASVRVAQRELRRDATTTQNRTYRFQFERRGAAWVLVGVENLGASR